jgi:hypothetical protein
MTIQFSSLLKGRLTESTVMALFERAGYRVTRMGVEELFSEIKQLELSAYQKLALPNQLRTLPDLLVSDPEITQAFLVEVKFRRSFDQATAQSLYDALTEQRRSWPESYAVVALGTPMTANGHYHQDHLRVIGPNEEGRLIAAPEMWPHDDAIERMEWLWSGFQQLQHVFVKFKQSAGNEDSGKANQRNADFITQQLAALSKL